MDILLSPSSSTMRLRLARRPLLPATRSKESLLATRDSLKPKDVSTSHTFHTHLPFSRHACGPTVSFSPSRALRLPSSAPSSLGSCAFSGSSGASLVCGAEGSCLRFARSVSSSASSGRRSSPLFSCSLSLSGGALCRRASSSSPLPSAVASSAASASSRRYPLVSIGPSSLDRARSTSSFGALGGSVSATFEGIPPASPLCLHAEAATLRSGTRAEPRSPAFAVFSASRGFACRPGASRMKWPFAKPYVRRVASDLFRFPLVSSVSKEKIDWLYRHPRSGYEGAQIFGPNTLEVTNLPMGKTCEYLQERLWRYFGKFGVVEHVRVLPNERDPYQTNGTAYVCFRSRMASLRAVRLPVHLPASLHSRVLHLRHLGTDKTSDDAFYFRRQQAIRSLLSVAQQLYAYLEQRGPLPADKALRLLFERSYPRLAWRQAGYCVRQCCGSWLDFFARAPFNELFYLAENPADGQSPRDAGDVDGSLKGEAAQNAAETNGRRKSRKGSKEGSSVRDGKPRTDREENAILAKLVIFPHLLSREKLQTLLLRAGRLLQQDLQNELSVHWRTDRPPLPDWTRKQIQLWEHQDPLPEELQIWSRTKDYYKIHEERFLFKLKLKKERAQAKQELKQQRR
ncbi:hypothetical protein BESB_003120 [Besnoitia besnoiti]|uniref:RRM domain-containing protein n=1 Tax=Besnoitia besnoiti TaxID=94643 RepID=A0A2A9MN87_BESBE|nr:hypothetical protein BESB_003120 [Besnoitia besnoiti]PFH37971.1 hypothetical protein BESB_003120 [Besnoitia besnoiti]